MKSIKLEPIMEEKDADALIGSFLDESFIKYHITEDTEVFKENGDLLCILKKNAVPEKTLEMARAPFRKAISPTNNRGSAAGDVSKLYKVGDKIGSATIGEIKGNQYRALLKDGWIQTNVGVNSTSIAGVNSKGTNTKLEKEIVDAKGLAVPLSVMKNQFEPEFLTYKGEIGAGFSSFREKMGLGKDDSLQKFTARRNQWLAANNQFFNNYRKAITGVAAGEKEIGYLKQSIPSDDDSASVYMAKLDQQILFNKKLIARNEQAILAGVTPEVDGDGNATGKWKEYLQREENKIKVSKDEVSKMAQAYKDAGFSEKISQFKLIQDFGEETYKQYFNLIK